VQVENILQLNKNKDFELSTRDQDGHTPLHLAIIHHDSAEIVQCLLTKFPAALTMEDNNGFTPLLVCLPDLHP
jgi:ankyrin repeat protein